MIPKSRLQEFGFTDVEKFPRLLTNDAVTLSLPSAIEYGVEPVTVEVQQGIAIPAQHSGGSNGMIIRSDGAMLHIAHEDREDPASPLQARFIDDIPYDVRVQVSQIMRRAVQADPLFNDVWVLVREAWMARCPIIENGAQLNLSGEFEAVSQAWEAVVLLMRKMLQPNLSTGQHRVRIMVQPGAEFKKGWLGEEFMVDEPLMVFGLQELEAYLDQCLFIKMQRVLRNPVFSPHATFKLFYEIRGMPVIKLVVVDQESQGYFVSNTAGIELNRDRD